MSVNDVFLEAVGQADVVLMVGGRFDYMLGFGKPPIFNPAGKAIQIDIEAEEIGRNRPIDRDCRGCKNGSAAVDRSDGKG